MNDATALYLELLAGLRRTATTLTVREWLSVLRCLRPLDARVVVLRVLHGLVWPEIAERVDDTAANAVNRWRRACRELRTPAVHGLLEVA